MTGYGLQKMLSSPITWKVCVEISIERNNNNIRQKHMSGGSILAAKQKLYTYTVLVYFSLSVYVDTGYNHASTYRTSHVQYIHIESM